jgi:uncharacterized protein
MHMPDGGVGNRIAAAFGPHAELAALLFAVLDQDDPPAAGSDGSHDLSHILRVWHSAAAIARSEPACDVELLVAAAILHDCVAVEKNSPDRSKASRLAAVRARRILAEAGWLPARIDQTAHAIEAHSFSAGIAPATLEARIVQDADRLDAIGATGIARCFYVAGRMGARLYDPADPTAVNRKLDDRVFALDHFGAKLFQVAGNFQTKSGHALAEARTRIVRDFFAALLNEIGENNR